MEEKDLKIKMIRKMIKHKKIINQYIKEGKDLKELESSHNIKFAQPL